jgi:Holliday junction DNA helicase RuvA
MIGYIKGKILQSSNGTLLIENNGIGYEIMCSASVYQEIVNNKGGDVFTYLAVREDGISLYGFISPEEKEMFLKLISVSGVGPKMGITVLSNMSLKDLALKIATNDVKGLSSVKGLGKKTAERIILELREKIGEVEGDTTQISMPTKVEVDNDAVIALMSLGFTKGECLKAVKVAKQNGAKTIEEVIAYSIRNIK